jgi:hypothetical protein
MRGSGAEAARIATLAPSFVVMAGLAPAIHVFAVSQASKNVDARHKAGHDD